MSRVCPRKLCDDEVNELSPPSQRRHFASIRTINRQDLWLCLPLQGSGCLTNEQKTKTMSFQASSAKIHYEAGSWQECLNDIYTGTVVGAAHSIYLVAKWWYVNLLRPILNVFGIDLPDDKTVASKDGEKTLKVVAVGYGRTGTVSCLSFNRHGLCPPNFQASRRCLEYNSGLLSFSRGSLHINDKQPPSDGGWHFVDVPTNEAFRSWLCLSVGRE